MLYDTAEEKVVFCSYVSLKSTIIYICIISVNNTYQQGIYMPLDVAYVLAHLPLVLHICVSKLGQHLFR